ncbi:MAG: hypothetical protein U5Q03_18730 [Bacteroidota bacterium]|nr:hypothetical protein [Bacteroidota bacterium]
MRKNAFHISLILLAAVSLSLLMYACKKDFSKILRPDWNPELAIPFIKSSIKLDDLLEPDSNLIINPDGSINVIYSNDSVFSIDMQEVFTFPDQQIHEETFVLGAIKFDNFGLTWSTALQDFLSFFPVPVQDSLLKYDGSNAIFPPLSLTNPLVPDPLQVPVFENLHFSEGYLIMDLSHELPVILEEVRINLYDGNLQNILGSFSFQDLPSATTASDSISLAGKSVNNTLYLEIEQLQSQGSFPDTVQISLESTISASLHSSGLKVTQGEGYINQQIVINEEKMLNLDLEEDIRLRELLIGEGRIDYTIWSDFPVSLNLKLNLPGASQGGSIPSQSITVPPKQPVELYWDLGGTSFDLSTNPEQDYNSMPVSYIITLLSSEQMVAFDSSNKIGLSFLPVDFDPSFARGSLGTKEVNIEADSLQLDLAFLDHFNSGMILEDPVLKLSYNNAIGLDFNLNLNLEAYNKAGDQQSMDLPQIEVLAAPQPGEVAYGEVLINKDNSSIVDFISISPESIYYEGNGMANPEGTEDNFVSRQGFFNAGIEMDLPVSLQAEHLVFTDTVKTNFSGDEIKEIERARFYFAIDNGFPFGILLDFQILDATGQYVIENISLDKILSARIDGEGKVDQSTRSLLEVEINNQTYQNLTRADKMVLKARMNTAEAGSIPVALYTDYEIGIRIALEIKGAL